VCFIREQKTQFIDCFHRRSPKQVWVQQDEEENSESLTLGLLTPPAPAGTTQTNMLMVELVVVRTVISMALSTLLPLLLARCFTEHIRNLEHQIEKSESIRHVELPVRVERCI
jgi:hypothetical protein